MLEQLWINVDTNLKFFRRNKLLIGFSILMLLMMGLSSLPAFFMLSSTTHFEVIKGIVDQLNGFATIFTAALGLFLISSHLKNRSIKMVLTKPCLPEVWLLSGFVSAALVSWAVFVVILLITPVLSFVWDIPYQAGFVYVTLHSFVMAVILLAYIMFLSMVMHPVLAVIVSLVMNEGTIFGIKFMMSAINMSTDFNMGAGTIGKALDMLYMVLPMTRSLSTDTAAVQASMRVSPIDWMNLLYASSYMVVITALFYLLSDYFLKRKKLI